MEKSDESLLIEILLSPNFDLMFRNRKIAEDLASAILRAGFKREQITEERR